MYSIPSDAPQKTHLETVTQNRRPVLLRRHITWPKSCVYKPTARAHSQRGTLLHQGQTILQEVVSSSSFSPLHRSSAALPSCGCSLHAESSSAPLGYERCPCSRPAHRQLSNGKLTKSDTDGATSGHHLKSEWPCEQHCYTSLIPRPAPFMVARRMRKAWYLFSHA